MKAVIINQYGSVKELQVADLPIPTIEGNEVLVKNYYTTVNPWDYRVRNGSMKMFTGNKFPKILGVESAGVIEKSGSKASKFKVGDRVMVSTGIKNGSYAEYVKVPATSLTLLPDAVSFKEGCSLPIVGTTAYNALHQLGGINQGDQVLINGAYGGVGIMAVQLAKLAGAIVTAVCSTQSIHALEQLGADHIIDYKSQDVYALKRQFDIVFDTVSVLSFGKTKRLLNKGGVMINTLPTPRAMLTGLFSSFSSKKFKSINNKVEPETLSILAQLVSQGKLSIIVDKEYSLNDLQEAHTYSESGRAKGKLVVKI
ncbi:MAG: NADP-dependent oxidoreductase [Bacteroidota bacterium]